MLMCMVLRVTRGEPGRLGGVVSPAFAHNERHSVSGNPVLPKALLLASTTSGGPIGSSRDGLTPTVWCARFSRFLDPEPQAVAAAAGPAPAAAPCRCWLRRLGGAWIVDRVWQRLEIGPRALRRVAARAPPAGRRAGRAGGVWSPSAPWELHDSRVSRG